LEESPEDALGSYRFVGFFNSFSMPTLKLVSSLMFSRLFEGVCLIFGHVLRPPIGGSASSNVLSGVVSPSTTDLAALFAISLNSTSVCDSTFSPHHGKERFRP